MIAAILGFIPAVDRRLNIAIRSGTAANVVPKPARKPTISDRCSDGTSRLDTSLGARSPQPAHDRAPTTISAATLLCGASRKCELGMEAHLVIGTANSVLMSSRAAVPTGHPMRRYRASSGRPMRIRQQRLLFDRRRDRGHLPAP